MTPQSFGGQLRKLREQHRVTLEVIEKKTKVSMSLLRSLESGGCEGWPGGIYSRGYIRAYAEAIGVDPEHVLAAFVECYPAFATAPVVEAIPEVEAPPPQTLAERITAMVTGWFRVVSRVAWPVAARASIASDPGERSKRRSGERATLSGSSASATAMADTAEALRRGVPSGEAPRRSERAVAGEPGERSERRSGERATL